METKIDRDRLARGLVQEQFKAKLVRCRRCGEWTLPYYYFINIRHPVIGRMWKKYKREHGISGAAGDAERLRFEVGCLSEEACAELQKAMTEETEAEHANDLPRP